MKYIFKFIEYINETNIKEQSSKDLAKTMAVLPQSPQAPKGLTVEELIAYGRFPHGNIQANVQ